MNKVISANNAGSALAASITAVDVSLTLTAGGGAAFASPGAGQYCTITIVDQGTGLIDEIIWYTTKTGDVLSGLVRGQEGTTAKAWAVYDPVANLWTSGQMAKMAQDPSDQLGSVSAVQTYAGNPNGHVAGNAAVVATSAPSMVWDTVDRIFWVCIGTGTTSTAIWLASTSSGTTNYCGLATGTANAIILTPAVPVAAYAAGLSLAFIVAITNTGATTVNASGLGAVSIFKEGPTGPVALIGGELVAGNLVSIRHDGTRFQLTATEMGTAALANASSITGIVAAVSGSIVSGHVPVFTDNLGTIGDGGLPNVGGAPFHLTAANNGQTIGPGIYFTDTSVAAGGAFGVIVSGAAPSGSGWSFVDQQATWATANFSVTAPGAINFVVNGATFQTVAANVSGWEFTVEFNGTNLGMI